MNAFAGYAPWRIDPDGSNILRFACALKIRRGGTFGKKQIISVTRTRSSQGGG
jgi:hypothetical protein